MIWYDMILQRLNHVHPRKINLGQRLRSLLKTGWKVKRIRKTKKSVEKFKIYLFSFIIFCEYFFPKIFCFPENLRRTSTSSCRCFNRILMRKNYSGQTNEDHKRTMNIGRYLGVLEKIKNQKEQTDSISVGIIVSYGLKCFWHWVNKCNS